MDIISKIPLDKIVVKVLFPLLKLDEIFYYYDGYRALIIDILKQKFEYCNLFIKFLKSHWPVCNKEKEPLFYTLMLDTFNYLKNYEYSNKNSDNNNGNNNNNVFTTIIKDLILVFVKDLQYMNYNVLEHIYNMLISNEWLVKYIKKYGGDTFKLFTNKISDYKKQHWDDSTISRCNDLLKLFL